MLAEDVKGKMLVIWAWVRFEGGKSLSYACQRGIIILVGVLNTGGGHTRRFALTESYLATKRLRACDFGEQVICGYL
jgi:hypothetical protein